MSEKGTVAQWHNSNRIVEALCVKLCQNVRSPVKDSSGQRDSRWTVILRQYENIRRLILNNAEVMEKTTLMLVALSQKTLVEWWVYYLLKNKIKSCI